jgi:16S rRNA (cytosine1402-N4)-methyltransferase
VNQEIGVLEKLLQGCAEMIADGGRLVVISYHSLEDRMVKNFIRSGNVNGELKKDLFGNVLRPFEAVNSKPIIPSDNEIENNNRAKLRIAEKTVRESGRTA